MESLRNVASELEVPFAEDLSDRACCPAFTSRIPIAYARRHCIVGLADEPERLTVAIGDLQAWQQLDVLSRLLRTKVDPLFAPQRAILAAINRAYQQRSGEAEAFIDKLDRSQVLDAVQEMIAKEDLLDLGNRAPVIQLVNLVLFEAVKALASDVHVQPYENKVVIRVRVDGILYDSYQVPKSLQEEVVSRIKVMGRMNIAEKRLAQDGRATVQVGDRLIDLRIASLPTCFGERIVIRLLDKSARLYRLPETGMPAHTRAKFQKLISLEHGLLLVTGPTGSGKTTTLYAALQELDCTQHNILTLEDPIEYQLEGISQTQVSDKKGMTFASGLRNVLRQDPDVIMVGEIRDRDTAAMAIQSALTGHLVFSTLHTNDAASAVARLLDLDVEPYLVASSLVGVLAQRLVRKVCMDCAQSHTPSLPDLDWLGRHAEEARTMRKGVGCPSCRASGYRGRLGIFELLEVDESIRRHVQSRSTASTIRNEAIRCGMQTMRDDGGRKVLQGITTIEEVERVTVCDEEVEIGGEGEMAGVSALASAHNGTTA